MITSLELRKAIRDKYSWPGGYEIFGITEDGGILCCDCMRSQYPNIADSRNHDINDGWKVIGVDCAANLDGVDYCSNCNKMIDPYGEMDDPST